MKHSIRRLRLFTGSGRKDRRCICRNAMIVLLWEYVVEDVSLILKGNSAQFINRTLASVSRPCQFLKIYYYENLIPFTKLYLQ